MQTQAIQDYLKAIHDLETKQGPVGTSLIAGRLGVSQASVTGMIKKLAEKGLVTYQPYYGVETTGPGKAIALEMLRHHRLIELYLSKALGVPWDKVHEEAERWEHVISEEIEDRMDEALGFPSFDPHGAPIPKRDGTMEPHERVPLVEVEEGFAAEITEVLDHDSEILRYLGERSMYPGAPIVISEIAPFEGPLTIEIDGKSHVLGRRVAAHVFVGKLQPPNSAEAA